MMHDALSEMEELAAQSERRPSILIVDDDADQCDALARRLRQVGFEAAAELTGRRALVRATMDPPDLVLLDLRLPDIDGYEVCRQLVDSPETCGIPVIIISALEGADIVRSCRAAGGEFFVRKPYDPNALLALIQHALRHDEPGWL